MQRRGLQWGRSGAQGRGGAAGGAGAPGCGPRPCTAGGAACAWPPHTCRRPPPAMAFSHMVAAWGGVSWCGGHPLVPRDALFMAPLTCHCCVAHGTVSILVLQRSWPRLDTSFRGWSAQRLASGRVHSHAVPIAQPGWDQGRKFRVVDCLLCPAHMAVSKGPGLRRVNAAPWRLMRCPGAQDALVMVLECLEEEDLCWLNPSVRPQQLLARH